MEKKYIPTQTPVEEIVKRAKGMSISMNMLAGNEEEGNPLLAKYNEEQKKAHI